MRPSLSMMSASSRGASLADSAVADMARMRSSGRSVRCRSSVSARARSDSSERSWISSKMTMLTPVRPGSARRRLVSRPSVTTSMTVSGETALSRRVRKPTRVPAFSPSRTDMRMAAARAARRRGSRSRILPAPASQRASGTVVVLPAPGGATRTAFLPLPQQAVQQLGHGVVNGQICSVIAPGYHRGAARAILAA